MGTYRVRMPQLGETVDSGIVAQWLKAPGDVVVAGEPLLEVETDKVDTEIESVVDGTLRQILVEAGQRVAVDTILAEIEVEGADAEDEPATPRDPVGAGIQAANPVRTVSQAMAPTTLARAPGPVATGATKTIDVGSDRVSPLVARMVAEHDLDLAVLVDFAGGGRVSKQVVQRYLATRPAVMDDLADAAPPAPPPGPADAPDIDGFVPFTRIRRRTAEHMVRSKATSPHVLSVVEVDYGAVQRAREAHADRVRAATGASLSYLPFVLHAVARTLGAFPHLAAVVEDDGLRLPHGINVGVAVDLDGSGLIVPVIRDADRASVASLAASIARLAARGRAGELTPDEIAGGCFTITSQGAHGTLLTGAIINQPQVAILSVDGVAKRPVVAQTADGRDVVTVGLVGHLALSWDHRAVDGTYAARFLAALRDTIEATDWVAALGAG